MKELLKKIFERSMLLVLLLSFYFLIDILIFKNKDYVKVFSFWQFPILLALYIDLYYVNISK